MVPLTNLIGVIPAPSKRIPRTKFNPSAIDLRKLSDLQKTLQSLQQTGVL